MRSKLCLIVCLVIFAIIADVTAEKVRRPHRRRKHGHRATTEPSAQDEVMNMLQEDEDFASQSSSVENTNEDNHSSKHDIANDPCWNKHCGAGKVCKLTDVGTAQCVCVETCEPESDPRRKVCTNYNETFGSDCEVYQARCFCDTDDERCKGPDYQHVHIEYYGECKQIPACKQDDMADFPRRMRDWLFNIMRDLADREELSKHYLKLEREAETNMTLRWTNAAIWKWCDLDEHPHDRSVSRHELFPIRAPLMSLEHCIAPFLDSCDSNDDHKITLSEWGKCLQLEEEDFEEKCDELKESVAADT